MLSFESGIHEVISSFSDFFEEAITSFAGAIISLEERFTYYVKD
jgi:hypothetical protein